MLLQRMSASMVQVASSVRGSSVAGKREIEVMGGGNVNFIFTAREILAILSPSILKLERNTT